MGYFVTVDQRERSDRAMSATNAAASATEPWTAFGTSRLDPPGQSPLQGRSQRDRITGWHEVRRVAANLAHSTHARRDEGGATREGFAQDVGDAFHVARQGGDVGRSIPIRQLRVSHRTDEGHRILAVDCLHPGTDF